jgi:HEPN domain-containing protein
MDEGFKKQSMEWFARGDHDIESAQLLYEEKGYTDVIAYHIQQAIEKYLKGYLVFHGKKYPKIHDLDTLVNMISKFDKGFLTFTELCEKVTRYYIEERYPPGPLTVYTYEEIKQDLEGAKNLINKIKEKLQI